MRLERLKIEEILVDESPYNIRRYLLEDTLPAWPEGLRVLPLVVLEDREGFHLLDGLKRLRYLHHRGHSHVDALVLASRSQDELVNLLYTLHCNRIMKSTIQRVHFLNLAFTLGASIEEASTLVRLKGHRDLKTEVQKISNLPEDIKRFFHEKNFSYMQILAFTAYPVQILQTIVNWKDRLNLTAQVFEELLTNISEYLRREGLAFYEFLKDEKLNEILTSQNPPKVRTEALRGYIKGLRFPFLEGLNRTIQERIDRSGLPRAVQISWDRTLEDVGVEVRMRFLSEGDITGVLQEGFQERLSRTIREVLILLRDSSLDR